MLIVKRGRMSESLRTFLARKYNRIRVFKANKTIKDDNFPLPNSNKNMGMFKKMLYKVLYVCAYLQ